MIPIDSKTLFPSRSLVQYVCTRSYGPEDIFSTPVSTQDHLETGARSQKPSCPGSNYDVLPGLPRFPLALLLIWRSIIVCVNRRPSKCLFNAVPNAPQS